VRLASRAAQVSAIHWTTPRLTATIVNKVMRNSLRGTTGLVLLLAWFVSGCAWVHQNATLQLNPQITPSGIGAGRTVAVRVNDRRVSDILGYRGLDSQDASITTKQNIPSLFEAKIIEGLVAKGFKAVAFTDQSAGVLNVEVKEIIYTTDLEFLKGSMQARASLRVSTTKNGLFFDQNYSGMRKETILEAPPASRNEELINAAISEAVQRMFEDGRLMSFLAN
jgi:uncharacterized lipoprotein YajG